MFEELLKLVTDNAQDAVINNPEVPNEQNAAVTEHVTSGILDGLKSQIAGGNIADVLKLVGGQGGDIATNPVVGNISTSVIGSLMQKFGLSSDSASNVVSNLLPNVINKFVGQTNDPTNSTFDVNGIFNHLSNGNSQGFDFSNVLNMMKGGASGGIDFSAITKMFTGGGNSNDPAQPNSGGGIMDVIGGLFGK